MSLFGGLGEKDILNHQEIELFQPALEGRTQLRFDSGPGRNRVAEFEDERVGPLEQRPGG